VNTRFDINAAAAQALDVTHSGYPVEQLASSALHNRVARLRIEDQDLTKRVATQMAALKAENRWHKSDPIYQRLSSVLKGIQEELRNAGDELLRRANGPAAAPSATANCDRGLGTRNLLHGSWDALRDASRRAFADVNRGGGDLSPARGEEIQSVLFGKGSWPSAASR